MYFKQTRSVVLTDVLFTMETVVEQVLEDVGFGVFQQRVLLLCAVGYFAVCAELLLVVFLEEPLMHEWSLSENQYKFFPLTLNICSFLSALTAGKVADRFGRQIVFTASLALVCIAGFVAALSPSFFTLIVLRSIVALGLGGLAVVDYVVFQELTPPSARGRYLYVVFVVGCLGVLYLALFPAFLQVPWRWLMVLAALPSLPASAMRCWLHLETPHYLVVQGRHEAAYRTLRDMAAANGTEQLLCSEADFLERLQGLSCRPSPSEPSGGSVQSLFGKTHGRSTYSLAAAWIMQSLAYWGLTLFLPTYFVAVGLPSAKTIFAMICCEIPGCCLTSQLMKQPRIGRRGVMRGNWLMAATAALLLASNPGPAFLKAVLACLIYLCMIPNWALLFLVTPEAYPAELRATAMGVFQMLQGVPSIASPFASAYLVQNEQAYMLVWGICLFLAFLAAFYLPGPWVNGLAECC
eukprot:TRINITY_DN70956_c0_g1_i1.p1 TRINITY_DN70956_c0_g1~~TRINITY_DN70956_c0_g1_i1.p1  ORF type:complete len:465 (-),score=78.21 TRINITY_DN70956_c0_g1_i1:125-1519(-)